MQSSFSGVRFVAIPGLLLFSAPGAVQSDKGYPGLAAGICSTVLKGQTQAGVVKSGVRSFHAGFFVEHVVNTAEDFETITKRL